LEAKISVAEAKKDLLLARSRRASTETAIRTTLTGLDQSDTLASFERMEENVDQQEARTAALAELEQDSVESRLEALQTGDGIGRQLAELKAKNVLPAAAEPTPLPAG
jgi:phage shock protein A